MALKHIDTSKTGYKPKETPYQKLMREAREAQEKERASAYSTAQTRTNIQQERNKALAEEEARKKALEKAKTTTRTNAYRTLQAIPTSSGKPTLAEPAVRKQNEQAADLINLRSQQNAYVPKAVTKPVSKTADARRGFEVEDIPEYMGNVPRLALGVAEQAGAALGVFADTTARASGWKPINEIGKTDTKDTPAMRSYAEATQKINQIANQYKGAPKIAIDAGTSMGRNILTLAASAVNPVVGMTMMGAMAAGDKAYQLRLEDVGNNEAIMRGIVSGIIEGATEAIPFNKLANIAKTGGNGFIRNLAEQVFTEATEEAIAYTANYIADKAANDPNAIFSVKDLAYSAALGGISGGLFGGGATAVNRVGNMTSQTQTPVQTSTAQAPAPVQQIDPTAQLAQQVAANPVEAASNPSTAASIIDPNNVETIMQFMREEYGTDAMGNTTPETLAIADEATQNLLLAAKKTVAATTTQQAATQATNTTQAVVQEAQTERAAQQRISNVEYIRRSNLPEAQKAAYEKLVQNTKLNIKFNENLNPSVAGFNNGKEIEINPIYPNSMDYLLTHEIGHYGENNEMINFAIKSIRDIGMLNNNGEFTPMSEEKIQGVLEDLKQSYARQGVQLDDTGAQAELAMRYYGELLKSDTKTIERLAKENPSFIQRIIEAIDDLITKVKGTTQEKQLVEARKRFVEAVRGGTQGNTRYSISGQSDTEGKQLTQAQAEYFKDSKVRDESGNLKVLYHGTSMDFTVFGNKGTKTEVLSAKKGYWFSDSTDTAEAYSRPQQEAFNSMEDYLSFLDKSNEISNPIWNEIFTDPAPYDFLKHRAAPIENGYFNPQALEKYTNKYDVTLHEIFKNNGIYDTDYGSTGFYNLSMEKRQEIARLRVKMTSLYNDRYMGGHNKRERQIIDDMLGRIRSQVDIALSKEYGVNPHTMTVYLNITNPVVARGEYRRDADKVSRINRALREGKDGVIFQNIQDGGETSNHYVVFSPEQIKSVDNQNPTNDPDIRYSLDDVDPRQTEQTTPIAEPDANVTRVTKAKVLNNSPIDKITFGKSVSNTLKAGYRELFDVGASIQDIAKLSNDNLLYPLYNNAKQGRQAAEYMITEGQYNAMGQRVGDSLIDIIMPVMDKGDDYYTAFQTYLYDWHHIDRIADSENPKPVFGDQWTAQDAQDEIKELAAKYPEFADIAKKIWKYSDNLLQYRVDTGIISQKDAEEYRTKYPHYVPTFRDMTSTKGAIKASPLVVINTGIKRATGSDRPLLPLHENLARQTMQVVQAGKRNVFGNRMLADAITNREKVGGLIQSAQYTENLDIDADMQTLPQLKNGFNIYVTGKAVQIKVNQEVYQALEDLTGTNDMLDKTAWKQLTEANKVYKKLITSLSPFFTVRNITRDLQDVMLYSKDIPAWYKALPQAINQIRKGGELWRLYQAQGGYGSSFFDYQQGFNFKKLTRKGFSKAIGKTADAVESLNFVVEQFPRFTEFVATINKGGKSYENIQRAMYNAADVTVNFGRHGRLGRVINSTFVPFFNPAMQGLDKAVRTFTQQPGARQWTMLVLRAGVWGILPSLLNSLLVDLSDDEEMKQSYNTLKNRDKDLNYLWYRGDGKWWKMPKGRVVSILGSAAQRALRVQSEGADSAWAGYLDTVKEQIAPQNPLESNIFAPLAIYAPNNLTWWGGKIETDRLQSLPASERYDESTDYFSKWLGGVLRYSPKKINYLLDSYTGIIGDLILPLMTPRAEQDPFTKAFTIDSKLSNKIGEDFYDKKATLTQESNSEKSSPLVQAQKDLVLRYYNKISQAVSDMYKELRAVENDRTLTDSDKRQQVREMKATIAALQQKALADVGKYEAEVSKQLRETDDKAKDRAYLLTNKEVFGAEYAIQAYNKDRYAKAQAAAGQGIPYSKYFDIFLLNSPDTDGNDSISQDEMRAALNKTTLTKSQKAFLFSQQNKEWKSNPYK